MAIYNTGADAANTAVRAFLTEVGKKYWGKPFNTGSGSGKSIWQEIKSEVFGESCCYCGQISEKLQIEHLIMFNREEYGLHHPDNVAPCCISCNKREKDDNRKHLNWENHLKAVCERLNEKHMFDERFKRISSHMTVGEYAYPGLSSNEKHSIRVIAESLYAHVKQEVEKSLNLYGKLTEAFIVDEEIDSK